VLSGDLLLAQTLRDFGATEDLSALRELFAVLVELAEGEWLQLEARYRAPIEVRHLYEVAQKKTGSLIGWCCWAPAHLAATPHALAFRRMGVQLGIAFQIIDDCVDFDVTSGKPFANDLREGQINFVTQDFLVHHPDKISDIFSPEALALIRGSDLSLLTPSLGRTLNKAQIEIETARNLLRQTKLPLSITHTIEGKIIEPFLAQLKMIRARLERTL
jgi:geranylgeranyl pyrophosphate synthase